MSKLKEFGATSLKSFCKDCNIPIAGKSMVIIIEDLAISL
jgi:hypothetical protein